MTQRLSGQNSKFLKFLLSLCPSIQGGKCGLVVGRCTCNPEVPGSNPTPCHCMDLSLVAPNPTSPCCVNIIVIVILKQSLSSIPSIKLHGHFGNVFMKQLAVFVV